MSFPRYPEYKDSGVEWLGEVPAHWGVYPLSRLSRLLTQKTDRRDHPVGLENIESWTGRFLPTETEFEGDGVAFEAGDILFGKLRPYLAKVYLSDSAGEAVGDFHVLRPKKDLNSCFARNQLLNVSFIDIVNGSTFGSKMPRASWESLGGMPVVLPPLDEQLSIAHFIQRETATIDALIAEQRHLIDLLAEKRQSVISQTVTKGLNPDAPMKPSGIDWLGDIPAHWNVVQSRRLFVVRNEPAMPTDEQLTASQKYGMIRQTEFIEREGRRVVEIIRGTDSLRHAEPNDFVISLRSFQGGLEWCRVPGSITFHYVVLTPVKHVHEPFFAHLFKSDSYIQALRATSNLIRDGQDLRYSNFVQVDLPVVPMSEQIEIANHLTKEQGRFHALTAEAQSAIDLLTQRRAALISAAVTGQIDVRPFAERQPA